jgi:PAS domain S-box-containing protein
LWIQTFLFKGKNMETKHKLNAEIPPARAQPEQYEARTEFILTQSGEMSERIRNFDWSQTPLGPVETWSPDLLARVLGHLEMDQRNSGPEEPYLYRSEHYGALLNKAPLGMYLVDADMRIREVNSIAQAVFGDIPDLIGRDFDEVIHRLWKKEYADEVVQLFRHTLETGESYESPVRAEYRIDRNRTEYYEWRLDRIDLPDGQVGVVCYFRDVSAQVQVQVRIAESEERYRGIVNQSVGAIVEADPSGRFTMVNDRFCEMTGYSREELLSLGMLALTHPEDLVRSRQQLEQLIAGGGAYEIEKRYIRRDGSVIWVHKSASAVRGSDGGLQSLIAVLIDITHSKQTEAALQQLNLHLENLVQERTLDLQSAIQSLREEIVGRIRVEKELNFNRDRLRALSRRLVEVQEQERRALARELHDRIGQGLTAVNLNLNILHDQLDPETLERVGSRLEDSISLLEDTIPAVRNLMSNLRPALLDEYGLVTALGTHLKDFSSRYGIPVRFEPSVSPVPRLESSIEITLLRIAQEALINIVKHARASEVSLELLMLESTICLRVQDNGVGMELSQPEAHPGSHGLTIMRERAEAVGGLLKVTSEPGKGTRIEVYIPVRSDIQQAAVTGAGK